MTTQLKVACIQTTSGPNIEKNIENTSQWIRKAKDAGASLIILPEVVNVMDMDRKALTAKVSDEENDKTLSAFRELTKELNIWLLIGSLGLKHESALDAKGHTKFTNRSMLLNNNGDIVSRYDKIHMFDVELGKGESYRESKAYEPGDKLVTGDTPWGKIGMTICYDIRFPHLYRQLAKAGANFLTIPAAFARSTGEAHWHVLARARAIENGCYVFAAAQCGDHGGGRKTYGHSLIVAPWGEIIADGGTEPGYIIAEVDTDQIDIARKKVPSLSHDREFSR